MSTRSQQFAFCFLKQVALASVLATSLSIAAAQVGGVQAPRSLFITGNVVMADGEPLPPQIELQRVCAGIGIIPEGFTDSDGNFSLQIGGQFNNINDAATRNANVRGVPGVSDRELSEAADRSLPEQEFWSCDVRARLDGYQSSRIPLVGRRFGDDPDVGTIVLRPLAGVQGATFSATTDLAPGEVKDEFAKALESIAEEDWKEAKDHLEKVVDKFERHAEGWYQLGRIHEREKDLDDAEKAYTKAIEADAQFLTPLLRLSSMALDRGDFATLLAYSDAILSRNPYDFPSAYYFNGVANLQGQNFEAAENAARRAIQLDFNNTNPLNHFLLGFVLAQTGRLEDARDTFNRYLELAPDSREAQQVRQVLTQIEQDLAGQQ